MNSRGLRAFSLGMILAVSILGTYYNIKDVGNSTKINQKIAKEYIEKKGFVVLSSKEYKALKEEKTKNVAEKPESTKGTDTSSIEKPASPPVNDVVYSLYIVSGMSSSEIAEVLASQKIVANKSDFEQFLIKNNYHTKVQLGTFELNSKMTYEQIAKIITKN